MVSVAFAIWPFPYAHHRAAPRGGCRPRPMPVRRAFPWHSSSKPRASFPGGPTPLWRRYCIATQARADVYDVNDVPSLSEPHGPYGAMADGGRGGAQIPQFRTTGRLGQGVRAACSRARTGLALVADLRPPRLRHRHGDGGE